MLLSIESIAVRAHAVAATEASAAPPTPAFAALEDLARIDVVALVELYPLLPDVIAP